MRVKNMLGASLGILVVLGISWWFASRPQPKTTSFRTKVPKAQSKPFSHESYSEVLRAYVDDQGLVDYQAIKANRQELDNFTSELGEVDRSTIAQWGEKEHIAFWINAYNSLTLEAIINHHPIDSSMLRTIIFPRNSIRQIPGVWDQLRFLVAGQTVTLNQIEHEILRNEFSEPRIHMALVCAAISCPPLRNEPFTGDRLDDQLDDQARRFLSGPKKFHIDRDQGRVYLSPIFDCFGKDFLKTYGTNERFLQYTPTERAVLNFIGRYLDESDRTYLMTGQYRIEYLHYDWSLNERKAGEKIS